MVSKRNILFISLAAFVAACGGGIEPKQDHVVKIKEELDPSSGENFNSVNGQDNNPGISLREAYLTHVHPVTSKYCKGCHIHTDGAHPFAGSDEDKAVAAAGRLIGTKLEEARFYVKVSDEQVPHPNQEIASKALPELKEALEKFFAAVAELGSGIRTDEVAFASAKAKVPAVNPNGFLIFEAEGGTIKPDTKFRTTLGVRSNGKAVGSTGVPNHPASGLARTHTINGLTNDNCDNWSVRIDQPAHTRLTTQPPGERGGLGIAKYIQTISATVQGHTGLRGTNGNDLRINGDLVEINDLIRVMPYNIVPGQAVTSAQYQQWNAPIFDMSACTFDPAQASATSCIYGTAGSDLEVRIPDTANSTTFVFRENQIDHLVARLKHQRNTLDTGDRYHYDLYLFGEPDWCDGITDRANYYETWVRRLCDPDYGTTGVSEILTGGNNKAKVFQYLDIRAGNRIVGQNDDNVRYVRWDSSDDEGERFYRITRLHNNRSGSRREEFNAAALAEIGYDPTTVRGGEETRSGAFTRDNLHPNETNINLAWFENSEKNPGFVSFRFTVPENLNFADLEESDTMAFRQYYRGSGSFRVRIKKESDDSFIRVINNQRCPLYSPGEAWTHENDTITLEKGETYSIEFVQTSQATVVDAFMLVADTELNENLVANPNTNPTILRQKFYGINGEGVQKLTNYMTWDLDFGRMEVEVVNGPGYYAIENPIFYMNQANANSNVSLKGINFKTNGNIALTDRSFEVDAVRIPGQIASFGQVLIPKDLGWEKDTLGAIFGRLEATSEKGSLPAYKDAPPLEGLFCQRPDVFKEWLWPVYSQQRIVRRDEYNDWRGGNYPARYDAGDIDDDPEVEIQELPTVYTCTGCHNIDHPFMSLNANDYLQSCDLIIARTNLGRPELSFSLRGLRGQFNHIPMYTIFNPWNGNNTLRKYEVATDDLRIYGDSNGALGNYSLSHVNSNDAGLSPMEKYTRLIMPSRIGFANDPEFNIPLFQDGAFVYSRIDADDGRYTNNNFSTWEQLGGNDNILDDHNATIDKWIEYGFKRWVEAEKAARR